ncbi:hypothetical protein NIES25_34060 [Nostoc linckia NIES-25]|nr:hypothetical protein NIES25_34060 [Nostoc linckia NIES-25]
MGEVQKKIDPRRGAQLCAPTHVPHSNENHCSYVACKNVKHLIYSISQLEKSKHDKKGVLKE